MSEDVCRGPLVERPAFGLNLTPKWTRMLASSLSSGERVQKVRLLSSGQDEIRMIDRSRADADQCNRAIDCAVKLVNRDQSGRAA